MRHKLKIYNNEMIDHAVIFSMITGILLEESMIKSDECSTND